MRAHDNAGGGRFPGRLCDARKARAVGVPLAFFMLAVLTAFPLSGCGVRGSAEADRTRALSLVQAGRYEESIFLLQEVVAADERDVVAELALAEAYRNTGMTDEALAEYLAVTRVDPENEEALFAAAVLLAEEGEAEQAKEYLNRLVRTNGEDARYWWELGKVLVRSRQRKDAVEVLQRAVVTAEEDLLRAAILVDLAIVRSDMGDEAEAEELLTKALELDPRNRAAEKMLKQVEAR